MKPTMPRQTDTPRIAAAYAHRRACQTSLAASRATISAALARTQAICDSIRQRGADVHRDANLDMIARLNTICALWVEMTRESRRTSARIVLG
jgi:hypothetical protein